MDELPNIFVVVRPQAFRRDPTYGPFIKTVLRATAARSKATSVSRMLDAFESCEEIVISYRGPEDAFFVLKGVRADLDAAKMVDADGQLLWRASAPSPGPQELVREERGSAQQASLFVLPQRVWVLAVGDARARARQAYATPFARPEPQMDAAALYFVRFDGPNLVNAVRAFREGSLATIFKKVTSVAIALRPKKEGLLVTFQYPTEDPAAWAELALKEISKELAEKPKLTWLNSIRVSREGNAVLARVDLPPSLLQQLSAVVDEGAL
jgi:hypothetical protein